MNELLLIVGLALLVDLLLSWITPKRKVPNVRVEESPFGTILVSDDLEAFDSLNRATSSNVNKAKEIVRRAKGVLINKCLVCNANPGEDCKAGCPVGCKNSPG